MKSQSKSPVIQDTIKMASNAAKESIVTLPGLNDEQKKQVIEAIDKTNVPSAVVPNTFVYWIAVGAVSSIAIIIVIGALILGDEKTPDFLEMILATTIGALAGMIVPTPKSGL